MRHHSFDGLVLLAALALTMSGIAGCSNDKSSDAGSTIESAARSYAEAILHGSADDVNAILSSTCTAKIDSNALTSLRTGASTAIGRPMKDVSITSVETRQVTGTTGQAWVHVDLPQSVDGNDNWLSYAKEANGWRLIDCTMLPFGGNSDGGTALTTAPK